MVDKCSKFSSLVSGTPIITLNYKGSENYLSWADFVEPWFIGNGYEDHLTTL